MTNTLLGGWLSFLNAEDIAAIEKILQSVGDANEMEAIRRGISAQMETIWLNPNYCNRLLKALNQFPRVRRQPR